MNVRLEELAWMTLVKIYSRSTLSEPASSFTLTGERYEP